jgi:hypothetical protein
MEPTEIGERERRSIVSGEVRVEQPAGVIDQRAAGGEVDLVLAEQVLEATAAGLRSRSPSGEAGASGSVGE